MRLLCLQRKAGNLDRDIQVHLAVTYCVNTEQLFALHGLFYLLNHQLFWSLKWDKAQPGKK